MVKVQESTKAVKGSEISRKWHIFDAKNKVLGRIADQVSMLLQGKRKVNYVPYLDMGDHVVIINAKHVKFTGKKADQKSYGYYSGYPGGLRELTLKEQIIRNPKEVVRHAVSGMLPKNKLRDQRLARLYIFPDDIHPHKDKFNN